MEIIYENTIRLKIKMIYGKNVLRVFREIIFIIFIKVFYVMIGRRA